MKPTNIYLIRHAQSEANVNPFLHSSKADHTINLTDPVGVAQARECGKKLSAELNLTLRYNFMKRIHTLFLLTFFSTQFSIGQQYNAEQGIPNAPAHLTNPSDIVPPQGMRPDRMGPPQGMRQDRIGPPQGMRQAPRMIGVENTPVFDSASMAMVDRLRQLMQEMNKDERIVQAVEDYNSTLQQWVRDNNSPLFELQERQEQLQREFHASQDHRNTQLIMNQMSHNFQQLSQERSKMMSSPEMREAFEKKLLTKQSVYSEIPEILELQKWLWQEQMMASRPTSRPREVPLEQRPGDRFRN